MSSRTDLPVNLIRLEGVTINIRNSVNIVIDYMFSAIRVFIFFVDQDNTMDHCLF